MANSQLLTLLTLFLGTLNLSTMVLNLVVLHLFRKSRRSLRSPTHVLIANLALADFLVGALVMPFLISITVSEFKWNFGEVACVVGEYVHFAICSASTLSVVAISVERYVGVKFPLRHKKILSRRRMRNIVVLIWLLAVGLICTSLLAWPNKGYDEKIMICAPNQREEFTFFISIIVFLLPMILISVMYFLTYKKAVELTSVPKDIDANVYLNTSVSCHSTVKAKIGNNETPKPTIQEKFARRKEEQTQLARKLTYIVLSVLVLYCPLFVTFFLMGNGLYTPSLHIFLIFGWLRDSSSCLNPILYLLVIPGYRSAFKKYILRQGNNLTVQNLGLESVSSSSTTTTAAACKDSNKKGSGDSGIDSGIDTSQSSNQKSEEESTSDGLQLSLEAPRELATRRVHVSFAQMEKADLQLVSKDLTNPRINAMTTEEPPTILREQTKRSMLLDRDALESFYEFVALMEK